MAKKYLTFEEICALPLLQQAIHYEEERHRARMADIQTMAKTLAALELERAEIERNGYRLVGDRLSRDFAGSTLRYSTFLSSDDVRFVIALLRSGWKVVDRDEGQYPSPIFKKGRVKLKLVCTQMDTLTKAERLAAGNAGAAAC